MCVLKLVTPICFLVQSYNFLLRGRLWTEREPNWCRARSRNTSGNSKSLDKSKRDLQVVGGLLVGGGGAQKGTQKEM